MTVVNSGDEITQWLNRPLSIFRPLGDLKRHLTWKRHTGLYTLNGSHTVTCKHSYLADILFSFQML